MNLTSYLEENGMANTLSKVIEVSPVMISLWKTGARQVPAERCPDIERATNGKVTCEELRPDLAEQWAYLRSTAPQQAKEAA